MSTKHSIGLLLNDPQPLRLPVLLATPDLLALNKPTHIAIDAHPLYPNAPSLVRALQQAATLQKQELQPYNIEQPQPIYLIEPDISGIALISLNKKTTEKVRNLFGSNQFQFTFLLLVIDHTPEAPSMRSCHLPLAQSLHKQQMIISHKHGKKAQTIFQRLESLGAYSLWSATTHYPRMDQIRIHAKEVGLQIPGEQKYYKENFIYLSNLKQGDYKQSKNTPSIVEKPLYDALCLHLYQLSWKDGDMSYNITAPLPSKFQVLLKKLEVTRTFDFEK